MKSFEDFVKKSVVPKLGIYSIIISTYQKVGSKELRCLMDLLKKVNPSTQIWFLGATSESDEDPGISRVSIISQNGIAYDKVITLSDWFDMTMTPIIYQDLLRLKYQPLP